MQPFLIISLYQLSEEELRKRKEKVMMMQLRRREEQETKKHQKAAELAAKAEAARMKEQVCALLYLLSIVGLRW